MRPGTLIEIKLFSLQTCLEREVDLYSRATSLFRGLNGRLPYGGPGAKARSADIGYLASPLPSNRNLDRSRETAKAT